MSTVEELKASTLQSLGVVGRTHSAPEVEEPEEPITPEVVEEELEEEDNEEEVNPIVKAYPNAQEQSPESEVSRLKQELATLRGELTGRLDTLKETVRAPKEEPAGSFDASKIDWSSPEMVRVFKDMGLDDEDAERLAPSLGKLISTTAKLQVQEEVKELRETVSQSQSNTEKTRQAQALQGNLASALKWGLEVGGMEAEVVKDFNSRGKDSALYQELKNNPVMTLTPQSVRRVVQGIASDAAATVTRSSSSEDGEIVGSREEVSAALSRGNSTVRKQKNKNQGKLTQEEEILQAMIAASPKSGKLPKFLR